MIFKNALIGDSVSFILGVWFAYHAFAAYYGWWPSRYEARQRSKKNLAVLKICGILLIIFSCFMFVAFFVDLFNPIPR